MSKVFTYSRLPEHQVAIYHDDSCNPERQKEWNVVECLFSFFAYLLLLITFPISIFFSIKVIKDYERAVVFRLGRLLPSKGPGVIFINPYIDKWSRVDIRARAFSVPPLQVRTSDGGYGKHW
ncbi:PREDICTED: stomatin-like protein 1 [Acropora digitifera]|uniref:stomatin-like protein 1 n=1 Tax=Acropora digitifera TaxID=70779 RepID=UPI00077AD9E8|nr:PREDICTED: stomatin-like protein 1 [Acropora digitifera]